MRKLLLVVLVAVCGCAKTSEQIHKSLTVRLPSSWQNVSVRGPQYEGDRSLYVQAINGPYRFELHYWPNKGGSIHVRQNGVKKNHGDNTDMIVTMYRFNEQAEISTSEYNGKGMVVVDITTYLMINRELWQEASDLAKCLKESL